MLKDPGWEISCVISLQEFRMRINSWLKKALISIFLIITVLIVFGFGWGGIFQSERRIARTKKYHHYIPPNQIPYKIKVLNGYAYVVTVGGYYANFSKLFIYKLIGNRLLKYGEIDLQAQAFNMDVNKGFVYIATSHGLMVINTRFPFKPAIEGSFDSNAPITDIVIKKDFAYVIGNGAHLTIFNINSLAAPVLYGELEQKGDEKTYRDLSSNDDYIFACSSSGGNWIDVIDVENPYDSKVVSSLRLEDTPMFAVANNDLLGTYTNTFGSDKKSIVIVNINNPQKTTIERTFDVQFEPKAIAMDRKYFYFCDFYGDLGIIDLSNLKSPVLYKLPDSGEVYGMCVRNQKAYIAGSKGVKIFDIKYMRSFFYRILGRKRQRDQSITVRNIK